MAEAEAKTYKQGGGEQPYADGSVSSDSSEYPPPPDGGWGWVIVLASFVVHFISDGTSFAFGVLYVEMLERFGDGGGKTAIVGALYVSVPLIAGPLAGAVVERYGCRRALIFSGVLTAVGYVLSMFATSVEMLCITLGIVAGLGLATGFVAAIVVIVYYFERRRCLATGLATCGSGIGCFAFAPLTKRLLAEYGFRGTMLITAGLFLNLVVCGALMRPLEWPDDDDDDDLSEGSEGGPLLDGCGVDARELTAMLPDRFRRAHVRWLKGQILVPCFPADLKRRSKSSCSMVDLPAVLPARLEPSVTQTQYHPSNDLKEYVSSTDHCLTSDMHSQEEYNASGPAIKKRQERRQSVRFFMPDCEYNRLVMMSENPGTAGAREILDSHRSVKPCDASHSFTSSPSTLTHSHSCQSKFDTVRSHSDILVPLPSMPEYHTSSFDYLSQDCNKPRKCVDQSLTRSHSLPSSLESSRRSSLAEWLAMPRNRQVTKRVYRRQHSLARRASDYRKPTLGRVPSFRRPPPSMVAVPIRGGAQSSRAIRRNVTSSIPLNASSLSAAGAPHSVRADIPGSPTRRKSCGPAIYPSTRSTSVILHQAGMPPTTEVVELKSKTSSKLSMSRLTFIHPREMPARRWCLYAGRCRVRATSCPDVYLSYQRPNSGMETPSLESISEETGKWHMMRTIVNSVTGMLNMSMLKNPTFLLFWLSNVILYMWYDIPYMYITDHALNMGIDSSFATFLVSLIGIVNTLGLIVMGYVGDRPELRALLLYAVCVSISGAITMLVPFLTSATALAVYASSYGFFITVNYALTSIILCDLLGVDSFASAYGLVNMGQGIANLLGPPFAGWLYDITGDYHTSFYLAGFCILLSGLSLFFMPCVQKVTARQHRLAASRIHV
ncbi:PREDICTED: uncharacterized protein LOC106809543 [Priapulus caudatus]|uniref:Uncharacterized protein LOC106809543 n=1 Tax=Priapulus caudatus TaxID=37621 RepID=A0ABM1E7F6_PRICU|nr:PREDICTED: uncharacterized protein LOC106809543 [Priapulus caudatus]